MNEKLRKYLESIGLASDASALEALRYWESLSGDQRTQADALAHPAVASGPAPEPQQTSAPAQPPVDVSAIRREAEAAERARVTEINGIASRLSLDASWAQQMVNGGFDIAHVKAEALEKLAAKMKPVSITVGDDNNRTSIGQAVADAVLSRAGIPLYDHTPGDKPERRKPHDRARQFAGRRLTAIAREYLSSNGVPVDGMADNQIAKAAFNPALMATHSTSDFPKLLADALGKSLRAAYEETPLEWQRWCRRVTAPDFKEIKRLQLGEAPSLTRVYEGGEYAQVTIGESREVYTLSKYGESFSHTWEMMINDDLNAFTRLPQLFFNAAARLEDVTAFAILTANANMSDSVALFHASSHGANLASGTGNVGAPTAALLNKARAVMRKQTGISSDAILNIVPRFLIVPAALEGTARALLTSEADPAGTHSGVANIWRGSLELVVHPRLDASSTTAWYLAADPAQIDTVEVCFLEGFEAPTIEQTDTMNPDKRTYVVRHVVASKAIDYRGLFKNPGA
jgi:hypothetical protein